MGKKKNIWITPHKDGWAVKREGSDRSSKVTTTKKEAEKFTKSARGSGGRKHTLLSALKKRKTRWLLRTAPPHRAPAT